MTWVSRFVSSLIHVQPHHYKTWYTLKQPSSTTTRKQSHFYYYKNDYYYPEIEIALTFKDPPFLFAWTAVRLDPPTLTYVASSPVDPDDAGLAVEAEDAGLAAEADDACEFFP